MADGKTEFDILFKTSADTKGAEQVKEAVEQTKEAVQDQSEATQQDTAATQESATAQKNEADSFDQAKESLRQKLEEIRRAREGTADHARETRAATDAENDMDASVQRLPTSLRALGVGLGGAAITLGVFKAGFDAFLEQNPEVQAALDGVTGRFKDLASTAFSDWFETWIMSAETAKSTLDSLNISLGGQTEEMKKAAGPLENFAAFSDEAATASKTLADELKREADNARAAMEAIDGEVEALKRRNALADAKGDLELSRKKREIDADPMLDAGQKAKLKAAEENKADEERLRREQEQRDAETAAAARKAQLAREQAVQAEQKAQAATGAGKAASLRGAMDNQIASLKQQLDAALVKAQGATDAEDPATKELLAYIEQLRNMIADLERNKSGLAAGDPKALAEAATKAREAAEKAAKEAAEVASRNATANDVDATRTTQRGEERTAAAEEVARREEQKRVDEQRKAAESAERQAREEAERQAREEQKRRDEEQRRLQGEANAAGRDVRGDGAAAVAGVRDGGMQQAAAALQNALGALNDGATAQELAQVQQLILQIAQAMNARGDGNTALREQLRGLSESVKTLKTAVDKIESREANR